MGHSNAAAFAAGQARRDDSDHPDYWADEDPEPPIGADNCPPLILTFAGDAQPLISECERIAADYCKRIGATDSSTRTAAECGALRSELRRLHQQAQDRERELLELLQLAVNETCGAFHDAGHMDRVTAVTGIVMWGEA